MQAPRAAGSERLLLIEPAVRGRFHRAPSFPFLHAWAKGRGLASAWVRLSLPPGAVASAPGAGFELGPRETGALAERIRAFAPTRVLFGHPPSEALVGALGGALRGARLFAVRSGGGGAPKGHVGRVPAAARGRAHAPPAGEEPTGEGAAVVEAFVPGESPLALLCGAGDPGAEGSRLFETVTPDFGYVPLDDAAARLEPLPFLVLGSECTFGQAFERAPFFAGVQLAACVRKGGCTFCTRPENLRRFDRGAADLFADQLEALARTLPAPDGRLRVRLVGEPAIDDPEGLVAVLRARGPALGLRPSTFLLDARPDALVEAAPRLRRALEGLRGTGHRLELALVGVESFSSAELERLNKGVAPETNVHAVRVLVELERDHPDTFGFREHGGLSLITFTPWTTMQELHVTLALVRVLGIEDLCGKLLSGRLRLYPGLALAQVARRDGLLTERYEDPLLDTARRAFYEEELPWRFREPWMAPLGSILLRLGAPHDEPADALARQVRAAAARSVEQGEGTVALAQRLVEGAIALASREDAAPSAPDLLRRALGVAEGAPGAAAATPSGAVPGTARAAERWERHAGLAAPDGTRRLGRAPLTAWLAEKPVLKLEPVAPSELRAFLDDPLLPNVRARTREATARAPEACEVFVGGAAPDVERALALSDALDRASDQRVFARAAEELGGLLGYPACCARAFAAEPSALRDHTTWMQVARRVQSPGPVPFEASPVGDAFVEHVPCALDCEATLARARRLAGALARHDPAEHAALVLRQRRPHLLLFGSQGAAVELVPETAPGERFRYGAGLVQGATADARAVCEGDELILERELVLVLRRGRVHAALSGRAFLWWHERALQVDLWRALVDLRRAVGSPRAEGPRPGAGAPVPADAPGWMSFVLSALAPLGGEVRLPGGYRLRACGALGRARVQAELQGEDGPVELLIELREEAARYLHAVGPLALSHAARTPLDTPAKAEAARAVARHLAAAFPRPSAPRGDAT